MRLTSIYSRKMPVKRPKWTARENPRAPSAGLL